MNLKSWAEADRPRERLLSHGSQALSDAELLAIIIGSGNRDETAVDLSKRILASVSNNLNELGKLDQHALMRTKGIGEAKALSIMAALELGRRRKETESISRDQITQSRDAFDVFGILLADLSHEEFWVLLLNRSNKIIEKKRISQGGIAGTVTDVRLILKCAIDRLATGIILCHNHPSGNLKPSEQDFAITKKIREAASLLDIKLLDHIIVSDRSYYSFADEGVL